MNTCEHDERFKDVFFCKNGCLACELEKIQSERDRYQKISVARDEGFHACMQGKPQSANPYPVSTDPNDTGMEWTWWDLSWRQCHEMVDGEKERDRLSAALHKHNIHPDYTYVVEPPGELSLVNREDGWEPNQEYDCAPGDRCWRRKKL